MDIELLKTFLEVTRVRHFGRAAENLFLTPAAVSARIRQLEQMLGVTLLHRTRGNIQMTTEGERLLPHAKKLLDAWSETLEDLSLKLEPDNRLTIGAISSIWHCPLPHLNAVLVDHLSSHRLQIESYSHLELVTHLLAQQLDVILLLDLPQHPELNAIKIAELELAMYKSASDDEEKAGGTAETEELLLPYIYVEWSAAFAAFHNKRVIVAEPVLRTTDAVVARNLMRQMKSSAYLPVTHTARNLTRIANAPRFMQAVYLVYRAGREHSENLGALLSQLKP